MQPVNDFIVLNIREYLENDNDERLGEDKLLQLLSEFSCPLNPDVERFLKQQSIKFLFQGILLRKFFAFYQQIPTSVL